MIECSAKTSVARLTTSPRPYTGWQCFYTLRGPVVCHLSQELAWRKLLWQACKQKTAFRETAKRLMTSEATKRACLMVTRLSRELNDWTSENPRAREMFPRGQNWDVTMQDCTEVASTTEKKHGGATSEIESMVMCPIGGENSATKHERSHEMHATRGHLYSTFHR